MAKQQLHKRLSLEHVKYVLDKYLQGKIKACEAIDKLSLGKTRFYELAKKYEDDPQNFQLDYQRQKQTRKIDQAVEKNILKELSLEKEKIIGDKNVPTTNYNYSYIKNLLQDKYSQQVSVPTIINRAKENGFYLGRKPKKMHDREVATSFIGELTQHDSSHHLFAPDGNTKWYLISSLDDYSRLLMYVDLWFQETTFAHISALESAILNYGIPFAYYVDQHRIFRYIKNRDNSSYHVNYSKFTDDCSPKWKQVLENLKVKITYALSPQAKGKIERPYRWLQDHLVRTCVREGITKIDEARQVLKEEVDKYNYHQVHSTTKEIPIIRFERAKKENKSLFKEFRPELINQTSKDIFCLKEKRIINQYRQIHFKNITIQVPGVNPGQTVGLNIYPYLKDKKTELRIWHQDKFLTSVIINKILIN